MAAMPAVTLADDDLSEVVQAADAVAIRSQRAFIWSMRLHYTLLVVAAACGSFAFIIPGTDADAVAILGALCFGTSLMLRVYRSTKDSETQWLTARAVAESTKGDSWRYAVGGTPYPEEMDARSARRLFLERQQDEILDLGVTLADQGADLAYLTPAMKRLRAEDFETRRESYLTDRLADQLRWYARKSQQHTTLADRWFVGMLLAEAAGLASAVVKAAGLLDLDLLGIFAAMASAFGAWNQMRQHRRTAGAYRRTAATLATLLAGAREDLTEEVWPAFVDRAERLMGDELSAWQTLRLAEAGRNSDESAA